MSNTMTAQHEPISYLDSILANEEEKRCEYSHQWRNFTISRSGRFKSKNKKRDIVDGKLFEPTTTSAATTSAPTTSASLKTSSNTNRVTGFNSYNNNYNNNHNNSNSYNYQRDQDRYYHQASSGSNSKDCSNKIGTYKHFHETNL